MHAFLRHGVATLWLAFCANAAQAVRAEDSAVDKALTGQVLDRAAYVRAVLAVNPSIGAAQQGFRAALARARQAGGFADPMLEFSMAPLSIGSSHARFGYELGIRQEFPWFGKRALERDAMNAEAAAAASDLETTRRELAMAALSLYAQYYVTARSFEINAQHVELLQALQAAATAQLMAGRSSTQDVLQAESQLTQLERDAEVLAADRDVVVAQMNALLHRAPAAHLPPAPPDLLPPGAAPSTDLNALEQRAFEQRAEINSARLRARARATQADAAEREYYPSFTLSTSYNSMWDMAQHRWVVGVGVNVPWPSERRAGAVDEARAMQRQYESEVARLRDVARTELYTAKRRLTESARVLELFGTRLLPVARQQIEAARAGFIAAQTPFMAVVEAERNLRNLELDHELAKAELDRRQAELERAQGRLPGLAGEHTSRTRP